MKNAHVRSLGRLASPVGNRSSDATGKFALRSLSWLLFLPAVAIGTVYGRAIDPGPRGGSVGAGAPIANRTPDPLRFFQTAVSQFTEVPGVTLTSAGNGGLGPTFNSNSCGSCHSQPNVGGTSPSTSAYRFIGPNPQVAVATPLGATNTVPFFMAAECPVRQARFQYVLGTGRGGSGGGREGFGGDRGSMNAEEDYSGVVDPSWRPRFPLSRFPEQSLPSGHQPCRGRFSSVPEPVFPPCSQNCPSGQKVSIFRKT
jgi:hypothetical protein